MGCMVAVNLQLQVKSQPTAHPTTLADFAPSFLPTVDLKDFPIHQRTDEYPARTLKQRKTLLGFKQAQTKQSLVIKAKSFAASEHSCVICGTKGSWHVKGTMPIWGAISVGGLKSSVGGGWGHVSGCCTQWVGVAKVLGSYPEGPTQGTSYRSYRSQPSSPTKHRESFLFGSECRNFFCGNPHLAFLSWSICWRENYCKQPKTAVPVCWKKGKPAETVDCELGCLQWMKQNNNQFSPIMSQFRSQNLKQGRLSASRRATIRARAGVGEGCLSQWRRQLRER